MKSSKSLVGLLLLFSAITFSRCTADQGYSTTSTKDFLSLNKWTVDYFFAGQDKTAQYSSFEFNFKGNGTVTGKTSTGEFEGTWSLMKDVNRNDVIEINIDNQPQLAELNDLWKVTDLGISTIDMNGVSTQLRLRKL
jgi:hypothetical protein